MALKLHYYELWPAAQAARVALLELGHDHELVRVDMAAGAHQTQEFLKLNPTGEPPILVDDEGPDPTHDLVTWGAMGSMTYFEERRKRLNLGGEAQIPTNPCVYPKTFQWAEWVAVNMTAPMSTVLLHAKIMPATERKRAVFRAAVQTLRQAIQTFETAAPGAGQFINRDVQHATPDTGTFSVGDILFGASLTYARLFQGGDRILDNHPKTSSFLASLESRSSFQLAFKGVTIAPPTPDPIEPPPP